MLATTPYPTYIIGILVLSYKILDYFRNQICFLLGHLMAHSLSEECTPLKHEYDSCFNAWFEGYLEPAVTTSSQTRSDYTKRKADEFNTKCGPVWEKYRACIQVRLRSIIFQQ